MEFTRILDCNVIHRLPRSTLRGTALKKGKPSSRWISEAYRHHQPSTSWSKRPQPHSVSYMVLNVQSKI
jgi:hypothetical protein